MAIKEDDISAVAYLEDYYGREKLFRYAKMLLDG